MLSWIFSKKKIALPSDYKKYIDPDAVNIVDQLERAGFETYLVGGCVRDVLLRKKPKDFDIATQATPQQVKAIVKRCFIIGKRFRIVVAKRRWRSGEITKPDHGLFPFHFDSATEKEFQITTFRRDPVVVNGLVNENVFGSPKEDAQRRDFTINALFLEPVNGKIVDFVGGLNDLNNKTLRVIGNPAERFREDPIRILRALRFVARADLKMDKETASALQSAVPLLAAAKKERVREEILKSLKEGSAQRVFEEFAKLGIWNHISPEFHKYLSENPKAADRLIKVAAKARAIPWTHPRNASPLFLLMLHDLVHTGGAAGAHRLSVIEEDLKISKAEKEEIHRILQVLSRIAKDPEGRNAARMLGSDPRHHANVAAAFYVFKILSDIGLDPYASNWKAWEPLWQERVSLAHPQQQSTPRNGAASSFGSRGRPARRRRGRRSESSTAAASSASPRTTRSTSASAATTSASASDVAVTGSGSSGGTPGTGSGSSGGD